MLKLVRLLPVICLSLVMSKGALASSEPALVSEASDSDVAPVKRSGVLGYGLGLEIPMVGVVTGVGTSSRPGAGYNLGAALSWEFLPTVAARLFVSGGETYAARAKVQYLEPQTGETVESPRQAAEWLGLEVGAGVSYLFRRANRGWIPFVGLDGSLSFHGYHYDFDGEVAEKLVSVDADSPSAVAMPEDVALGWRASVRSGIRLELMSWLQTSFELSLSYVDLGAETITDTKTARQVQAAPEALVLTRLIFSVWLGV